MGLLAGMITAVIAWNTLRSFLPDLNEGLQLLSTWIVSVLVIAQVFGRLQRFSLEDEI